MAIIVDPDDLNDGTEITITTASRTYTLTVSGNLSNDGVTKQCIYSFFKIQWKDDPNTKDLLAYPFPTIAITPEQFEDIYDWAPFNNTTRKLIRTGGWREIDTENGDQLKSEYAGIITLGTFETPATDTAYYVTGDDPTDTAAAIAFDFPGPVNEAVLTYEENVGPDGVTGFDFVDGAGGNDSIDRNDAGSWITDGYRVGAQITVLNANTPANDGTYVILSVTASTIEVATGSLTADTGDNTATFARNYRNALQVFIREQGSTYDQAELADIGVAAVDNKVFRFPLGSADDLNISASDGVISTTSPWTEVRLRYLSSAYNREVDSTTKRAFGIVIDVGTYSQSQGASASSTLFTSASLNLGAGEQLTDYTGGTLTIHEGTDQGTYTISGTPVDNAGTLEITLTASLTATESNLSFTMDRSSPLTAVKQEIYEKIQYQLRQAADIDDTANIVVGETASQLLEFVGSNLKAGSLLPTNPNGGGSGVIIEGFNSNDTNDLSFFDNTGTEYTFPFVAAGTINFNVFLQNDTGPAVYTMFYEYTHRDTVSDAVLTVPGTTGDAVLDSAGTNIPTLVNGDYINLQGFANQENNGIWVVNDASPTTGQVDIDKYNGETPITETISITLDRNPINSPDAIIVQNNSAADISGTIGGPSVSFDYDYDNNTQGGRTSGTDAAIVIRGIGTDTAQYVETTGTITRSTGLSFSLVAAQERNYFNPA